MSSSKLMCRVLLPVLIISATLPQLAVAASDAGTLLVGQSIVACTGGFIQYDGYDPGLSIGAYSPTGLTGGKTVKDVADEATVACLPSIRVSFLVVGGFSSNPGSSWLTSVECNGVTNSASSANFTYFSSSGVAEWDWSQLFGLSSKNGKNVSCTIVHS